MFFLVFVLLLTELAGSTQPKWDEGIRYEFYTQTSSSSSSSVFGEGKFFFNFPHGWKVNYRDPKHAVSYKVFNRDEKAGHMIYVDLEDGKKNAEVGCMKMQEKTVEDQPCKNGVFKEVVYLDPTYSYPFPPVVAYKYENCNFGDYLMEYFPSTAATNFTFYYDVYDTNKLKMICYDGCNNYSLVVYSSTLISDEEMGKEFSVPEFC